VGWKLPRYQEDRDDEEMTPERRTETLQRDKNLETLASEPSDLLVIGGGITGAGIARDAALRGLRVALVEKRDFAAGTSSRSSKLIHGGVRYLEQGDVGLVMEAAHERRVLRSLIPHLVCPHPLLLPVRSRSGYVKLNAGLWTFDRMARAMKDERYQMFSRDEALRREPRLRGDRLYGAGMYLENVSDDARLVLANLKSATALGAVVVNHAGVTGLLNDRGRVSGAVVEDNFSGASFSVRARAVVNAAGPWVDEVRSLQGGNEKRRLHLTKGIHLVLPRERLDVSHLVVMSAADRRSVFVVPRGDVVYLGTTDTNYEGSYAEPWISAEDADYLLDAANVTFDVDPLTRDHVVGAWAGLRPLLHQEGRKPSEISRKDEIMVADSGLISIAGGKLTTYRKMAERAVDLVCAGFKERRVSLPEVRGDSETDVLSGGDTGTDVDAFGGRLHARHPEASADAVTRLVGLYGSHAEAILKAMRTEPTMAEPCAPRSAVTRAEVAYAVEEEMAMTVGDFLERRARLFLWDTENGLTEAPGVASFMGQILGWSDARRAAEVAAYEDHVRAVKSFRSETEQENGEVAHG
jgi:glycerol-3-phosphate dehydrogenase